MALMIAMMIRMIAPLNLVTQTIQRSLPRGSCHIIGPWHMLVAPSNLKVRNTLPGGYKRFGMLLLLPVV